MNGFQFADPLFLLLLIPVALIAWLARRRRTQASVLYSSVAVLQTLPRTLAWRIKRGLPAVTLLGLVLLVTSLARPQQGREEFRIRTEGIAIEMCIDHSGSMRAVDFQIDGRAVNRLEAVKHVFRNFVGGEGELPGRPDDLIGLISFGGFAEALCPQTLDHGALLQILEGVDFPKPIQDRQGRVINEELLNEELQTAIGDAVTLAVDRLKDVPAKSRVIILLSDGENTAGVIEPAAAAQAAKEFGIRIYSIGVGTTGMAPFPARDLFGEAVLMPQAVRLDEETLRTLSDTTGGRYFNAQSTASLEEVYAEIDQLEKTETEGLAYMQYRELFPYLLWPGIGCLVLESLLTATRFRSLP